MSRWTRWLGQPWMSWVAALVAMGLCLPALGVGLHMDDYGQRMIMLRAPGVLTEPLAVFASLPGDPELNRRYMDQGILPWWTVPDYRLAFSRILSAISMWIDYRLWPDSPMLMHAHSLLWLGLMVLVAALLYRRLVDPWTAGLAALLYAFDEAHAMPAAWLANRNALIATALGLLALLAHDRWRRDGRRRGAGASAGCLTLALLSGEAALGAVGYLAAYAITLEDGPWSRRLGSLLPAGAVLLAWAAFYRMAGLGAHGSGLYLDPGDGPAPFAAAVVQRAPFLMLGQWTPVPAETSILLSPEAARLAYAAAWIVVAVLAVLFVPLLRRDRTSRFLALGMLLALLPATATFPANRLLTFAGFGAMGLLAQFLAGLGRTARWYEKTAAVFLILTHLVIAPLMKPVMAAGMKKFGVPLEAAAASLPTSSELTGQDLIVVSSPDYLTYVSFLPSMQHAKGKPMPRRMVGLLAGQVGAEISRPNPRTLRVRVQGGLFEGYLGQLFRNVPLKTGHVVELPRMRVEVVGIDPKGQPTDLRFRFPVPLEDPSLRWITWKGKGFVPFIPPAVGESLVVPVPPSAIGLSMGG